MVEKTEQDGASEILEKGNIYFAYRPKVRPEGDESEEVAAEDLGEVQNFYIVLKPQGGKFRLINVGRKRLPDIGGHERNWGFVDLIADSGKDIEEELQRDTYETKTRGERERSAARPAGEGVYALVREGSRTPPRLGARAAEEARPGAKRVQHPARCEPRDLDRQPGEEGRAAHRAAERGAGRPLSEVAAERVRGRKFATEDPRLLDYEGAEVIFIGAREDPEKAYHIDLRPDKETEGSADIFKQLRFAKSRHPAEPLLRGEWR